MKFYRKGSFYFYLLILIFVLILLSLTLGYDETTRLMPLIVLIPATLISLYSLAGVFFPALLRRTNVSLIGIGIQALEADESTMATSHLAGNRGLLIITVWLIFSATIAVFFGYLITFLIALFIFFKFVGKDSWFRALIISVAFTAVIYLTFNLLMRVSLFKGVIFGDLFLP